MMTVTVVKISLIKIESFALTMDESVHRQCIIIKAVVIVWQTTSMLILMSETPGTDGIPKIYGLEIVPDHDESRLGF